MGSKSAEWTSGSKKQIIEDDEGYNPFLERIVEKPVSTIGSFFNLLIGALGAGVLALPYAYYNSGLIFGSLVIISIGVIYGHCVHMLVGTSQKLCKKYKVPKLTYAETAEKAFDSGPRWIQIYSKTAKMVVEVGLMSTAFSGCVFILFAATTFQTIFQDYFEIHTDLRIFILILSVPEFIIGQIRYLKVLAPISAIANLFIMITITIVLYYIFNGPFESLEKTMVAPVTRWPTFLSIATYAVGGMVIILPVEHSMKKPEDMLRPLGISNIAVVFLVTLYIFFGICGYLKYGEYIKESISLNLPKNEILSLLAQSLMSIALLSCIGIVFQYFIDILWSKVQHKIAQERHSLAETLIRGAITVLIVVLAILIPNLGIFISILGALVSSNFNLLFPALIQTAFLHQNYGKFKWKLIINLFICTFSLLTMFLGLFFSISDLIELYR